MTKFPDTNGNGVPDAFENRLPITEILNAPPQSLPCDIEKVIVELEAVARCPKKGELYIGPGGEIAKATIDYSRYGTFKVFVITRIISGEFPVIKKR